MRRITIGLILASMVLAAALQSGARQQATQPRDQIAAATAAWGEAYNSRDPQRITALYDKEAVFWGTTAKSISADPERVFEYFKNSGNRPDARVTFGEQHIRVYGEIGINTGYYTFSDVRDGQKTANASRFTFVFRNRGGQWLIVDHHSSRVP